MFWQLRHLIDRQTDRWLGSIPHARVPASRYVIHSRAMLLSGNHPVNPEQVKKVQRGAEEEEAAAAAAAAAAHHQSSSSYSLSLSPRSQSHTNTFFLFNVRQQIPEVDARGKFREIFVIFHANKQHHALMY